MENESGSLSVEISIRTALPRSGKGGNVLVQRSLLPVGRCKDTGLSVKGKLRDAEECQNERSIMSCGRSWRLSVRFGSLQFPWTETRPSA